MADNMDHWTGKQEQTERGNEFQGGVSPSLEADCLSLSLKELIILYSSDVCTTDLLAK